MRLLFEHNSKLGNVLVRAEEGECEGERNMAGEMEWLGTKRYADGSVYEGEWNIDNTQQSNVSSTASRRGAVAMRA